jgi:hypothetical protein
LINLIIQLLDADFEEKKPVPVIYIPQIIHPPPMQQLATPQVSEDRDGIHQIVSRLLERFRYMCPLLFSCVFPS